MSSLLHVVKRNGKNTKIQKYVMRCFAKQAKKIRKNIFWASILLNLVFIFLLGCSDFRLPGGQILQEVHHGGRYCIHFFFSVTVVAFQPACWWGSGTFLLSDPYDTCTLEIIVFLMVDIFHNRIWRNNPYLTWCAMLASALYIYVYVAIKCKMLVPVKFYFPLKIPLN